MTNFLDISSIPSTEQILTAGEYVITDFPSDTVTRILILENGAKLTYFASFFGLSSSSLEIRHTGSGTHSDIRVCATTRDMSSVRVHAVCTAPETHSDMRILTLAPRGSDITLDGALHISAGVYAVEGSLRAHHVFLGNGGKIRGTPGLLVASEDVRASHSCTMESLSEETLFYLGSRGLSPSDAARTLIESHIYALYDGASEEYTEQILHAFFTRFYSQPESAVK